MYEDQHKQIKNVVDNLLQKYKHRIQTTGLNSKQYKPVMVEYRTTVIMYAPILSQKQLEEHDTILNYAYLNKHNYDVKHGLKEGNVLRLHNNLMLREQK